jgi:two-component system sensor histidine kinase KdpD
LNPWLKNSLLIVVTIIVTVASYAWSDNLGLTGISMLFLLLVVSIAYNFSASLSVTVAIFSFLTINYLFVEPKFTFQVGHFASWASLLSFLIVSLVITSLVKRLKQQTIQSKQAFLQAEFLRKLAEKLGYAEHLQGMLEDCQDLLQSEFGRLVLIIKDKTAVKGDYKFSAEQLDAIAWVQANGKPLGFGTSNWAESDFWIVPFNRLASDDPIVFVPSSGHRENTDVLNSIRLATDQIAVSYWHLEQKQKAITAENQAREESVRSALLASIAHDMRTPLTSILGAATTISQSELDIKPEEIQHLTAVIASQARHLVRTTENILSLIRLEALTENTIPMDMQSLEEIAGTVFALYQHQTDAPKLAIQVKAADLLIYANHDLITLALCNLIENAKQANINNNLSQVAVQINIGDSEGRPYVEVCDDGQGFEAGFNVSNIKKFKSNSAKGFGLGLSIVEAVANLHEAELNFNQGSNGGAIVGIVFNKPEIDLKYVG